MEYIGIPSITIICYLVGEIFKILILKKKRRNKYIPIIVGITGGIIGLIAYYTCKEIVLNCNNVIIAISIGIVSGLASTGGFEVINKLIRGEKNELFYNTYE